MPIIRQEEFEQLKRGVLPDTGGETPYFKILLGNYDNKSFFHDLFSLFENLIHGTDAAIDFFDMPSDGVDNDSSRESEDHFDEISALDDAFDNITECIMPQIKEKISAGARLQDVQSDEKLVSYIQILFQQTVLRYWDRAQQENIHSDLEVRLVLNAFQHNAAQQKTGETVSPGELRNIFRLDNN
jgi:hypothetical protein